MKRKRIGLVSRADGLTLRRIAAAGGLIVTHRGAGVFYTLRNSRALISTEIVRRLITARVLLAQDKGLFDAYPQSYRVRLPSDGKP
jgi:hypothetical protein